MTMACLLAMPAAAIADTESKGATRSVLDEPVPKTRFYFRIGGLHMAPNVNSDEVSLSNLSAFAQLAVEPGPIAGSGATVESLTVPAAMIGYVLPYLDGRLSIETVLGLPLELKMKATGSMATESLAPFALGNVPTGVPALGEDLGTAKGIPPVVTAVYRFLPDQWFHPYAGGGLSMMFVYDAKITNPLLTSVSEPTMDVGTGFGLVAQGGIEARVYDRYYATLDLKTIVGMSMEATVYDIYVETPELPVFDTAHVGDATVELGLLPLIVTLAAGADF
jgi:outer membrane protein W